MRIFSWLILYAGITGVPFSATSGCGGATETPGAGGSGAGPPTATGTATNTEPGSNTATGSSAGSGGGTVGQGGAPASNCSSSDSNADCALLCAAMLAPNCADGPGTKSECETICEALNNADCPEWGGVVDCLGPSPTFACVDNSSTAVSPNCAGVFDCVESCVAAILQGAGGSDSGT